jgi:hypothetical protein
MVVNAAPISFRISNLKGCGDAEAKTKTERKEERQKKAQYPVPR